MCYCMTLNCLRTGVRQENKEVTIELAFTTMMGKLLHRKWRPEGSSRRGGKNLQTVSVVPAVPTSSVAVCS